MKNKFFTHKFLPILSVFLFVLYIFILNDKVYAANTDFNINSVPDVSSIVGDNYYFIYKHPNYPDEYFLAFVEGDQFKVGYDNGNNAFYAGYGHNYYRYEYYISSNTGWLLFDSDYKSSIPYFALNCHFNWSDYIVYSNYDVYAQFSGEIVHHKDNNINYSIELSTNYATNGPLIAYSNYFNYSDAYKYECYISIDAKNWTLMNYETFNDTINNTIKFRFNYKIYDNGCYYFKFLNTETNEDYYLSYNISNIIKNSSNSGFTSNGIPQPFCTYERVYNEFLIKTQSFSAEELQKYRCFYTTSPETDYSSWVEMSMGSFNNTLTGETEYYFFFTVPSDSEDCIFYFVFYDNNLKQYGSPSSMNCFFDKMNEYSDSLSPTISKKNNRFYDLLNYFKERFGFLTYPFEFLVDFFNRLLNINYSEPIIHIPELREPFGNNKIFNGIDFNFNSLLNNSTFSYLYNIYLIAVDFVIVVLFIFLCKKVIEEVFTNG